MMKELRYLPVDYNNICCTGVNARSCREFNYYQNNRKSHIDSSKDVKTHINKSIENQLKSLYENKDLFNYIFEIVNSTELLIYNIDNYLRTLGNTDDSIEKFNSMMKMAILVNLIRKKLWDKTHAQLMSLNINEQLEAIRPNLSV